MQKCKTFMAITSGKSIWLCISRHFKTFQDQETSITKEQFYTELDNASAHQLSQASADTTQEFLY